MMRRIIIICIVTFSFLGTMLASENLSVEKISKTTYVVLPKEGGPAVSNSVFIILDEGVLVIDSQVSKELAEELLREIKKITPKPVKYLVNTHFHRDHTGGNPTFFPQAQLILHHETLEQLKKSKDTLKDPVISIQYECSLVDDNNKIHINWLGRGHTNGDLFVHLPEEDILILGDLFFNDVIPYVKDGHIKDWLAMLDRIIKRTKMSQSKVVVPGHGSVGDFQALRRFRELLAWAKGVVNAEFQKGTERMKIIDTAKETKLYKMRLHKYDHQDRLPDLLDKVYQELMAAFNESSSQE
jgi:glyoxylase-like metal-dependent hydrolase (beta-lactamase superfamily II)